MTEETLAPLPPSGPSMTKEDIQTILNSGVTKESLNLIFSYKDGRLYWKAKIAAKVVVGKEAGSVNSAGYRVVRLNKKDYLVHRLIWIMHNGPTDLYVDHINRNTLDNRIENLRTATHAQNIMNGGMWSNNTSGVKGVYWSNHYSRWIGEVKINGKKHKAGSFKDKQQCASAVAELRARLHGEFARQEVG